MDNKVYEWISANSPWAIVIVIVISILGWILRILNDWSPMVQKLLGPLGRRWAERSAKRFIRSGADYENMSKQIIYLFTRVHFLEYESQLDHQFRFEDEMWHRQLELTLAAHQNIPARKTYDQFRREYAAMFPYIKPDVDANSY